MNKPTLRVLSLGAGVQSTVMALMAAKGEIGPLPDVCIFADTQWEPIGVYEHLDWLESEIKRLTNGRMATCRVTAGNIKEDHIAGLNTTGQRFAGMPLFSGAGMGRRQCTNEYKIQPLKKKVRSMLGLEKGQRVPKTQQVETWLGISTDESLRLKPSRDKWNTHRWPLIEEGMARHHCHTWFNNHYPGRTLKKSACIGCPFHNDLMWRDMKISDPESFAEAVDFDKQIRTSQTGKEQFVHRSLKPLDEVDFRNLEDKGQLNMFNNECLGMCGV
jgi:hypothetical protein